MLVYCCAPSRPILKMLPQRGLHSNQYSLYNLAFTSPALPVFGIFFLRTLGLFQIRLTVTLLHNDVHATSRLRCLWKPVGCIDNNIKQNVCVTPYHHPSLTLRLVVSCVPRSLFCPVWLEYFVP